MKISYNWLKEYLPDLPPADSVSEILTGCGLEVENMETWYPVKGGLKGLVTGTVMEKMKHPNADKLSVTKVSIGDGTLYQIVCGAPNVEAGQNVIVATTGTMLYPVSGEPFEIKKSKIRGEISEGMICAEDEIGLGLSHDGIMVLPDHVNPGTPAAEYFNMKQDIIFEIGLTPNRGDAASHIGVARDIAAVCNADRLYGKKTNLHRFELKKPAFSPVKHTGPCPVDVIVENHLDCPRYAGVYFRNIQVGESPDWLKNKLLAIGLKPINNLVDLTNFIMLETGQPLHAFDAEKIKGNRITVKKLPAGTSFKTLDATERKLTGEELMICDEQGGLCMAGVYGGLESGVSEKTTAVFLESAFFNPSLIRKSAKHHALRTDASFRFERGADPEMAVYALKRAVQLMSEICVTTEFSDITDHYPAPVMPASVTLVLEKLDELAGMQMDRKILTEILHSLEIKVVSETEHELKLEVPAFKSDVTRPVDVMEEILRIYGYNRIPMPQKLNSSLPVFPFPERLYVQRKLSQYLAAQGFNEIMGNSLTRSGYSDLSGLPGEPVSLINPLSNDLSVLRQSLLFSGLEAVIYNKNRKHAELRLFEFGKVYYKKDGRYLEENHLSLLLSGKRQVPHWMAGETEYSIYYLKSLTANLAWVAGISQESKLVFKEEQDGLFSPALSCYSGKRLIARMGMIRNNILKGFDLDGLHFSICMQMDEVMEAINNRDITYKEVTRFPEVKRDLSMMLDTQVTYENVEKTAFETESKLLKSMQLFDVYEGDKIEKGKKSYAVSFFIGDDQKTLEDKQIDSIMTRLMKNFEQKLGAVIRKG